jgi:membrane protease subunit HflK
MRWLLIIPAALVVLYLLTGVVQVRPGERAVIRRFGRVLEEKPGPGLLVGLPWGMDRVDRVEVDAVREITVGYDGDPGDGSTLPAGQLLTGDNNLVNVQFTLYYKVAPSALEEFVLHAERAPAMLTRTAEAVAVEWVASQGVDDVLLRGKTALRRELIEKVGQRIQGLGVLVTGAEVSQISPPDEVRDAFDSVARAQTQKATARFRAEQEAATRLLTARGEAFRIGETARAYAHARKTIAHKEAARFLARLAQYREGVKKNPDYLRQIWQEERSRLFETLKQQGRIGLLDHHLHGGGLELFTAPGK